MKLSKVLSLVIAFAMLLTASTLGTAYAFSDVATDSDAYEAVTALSALNIIKGYEDGTFLPDGKITRAEFATIVMRTLGMNVDSKVDTIFNDVKADHWASGAINEAFGASIVNGRTLEYAADNKTIIGGTFDPEAEVTYDEAVKMIVCAMGYNLKAESLVKPGVNPFPTAYNLIANQKGITDGVAKVAGGASRATVAKLIWNALPVGLMDQTSYGSEAKFEELSYQSLLYTKLKAVLLDAKIESISLDKDDKNVDLTNIELDDVANDAKNYDGDTSKFTSIEKGACDLTGLQGLKVKVLVDISDSKNPVAIAIFPSSDNKYLTVDPDLFVEIKDGKNGAIEYYKSVDAGSTNTSSKIEYPFSVYSNLMHKGTFGSKSSPDYAGLKAAILDKYTVRDNEPNNISYEFVDTNNNGYYDTMFITNRASFVVGKVNAEDNSFSASTATSAMNSSDTYKADPSNKGYNFDMELDPEDDTLSWSLKDDSGKDLKVSDINVGDVVTLAKSSDGSNDYYDIVVCKSSAVTGSISEIKEKTKNGITKTYYIIDGKSYELNNSTKTIDAGSSGTFNITADGKIISYDLDATTRNFAVAVKAANDDDSFSNGAAIQLMTADGTVSKVKFASDFYINDGSKQSKFENETTFNNEIAGSVVMYELNKNGEIKKLYYGDGIESKTDKDYKAVSVAEADGSYRESSEKLGANYLTDSSVVVSLDKLSNIQDKKGYSLITKNSFIDDEKYAYKAVINSDKEIVMVAIQGFTVTPAWDSKPLYVTGTSTTSVDGETRTKVTGYVGKDEVSYVLDSDVTPYTMDVDAAGKAKELSTTVANPVDENGKALTSSIKAGDAIQFTLNGNGEINGYRHIVKAANGGFYFLIAETSNKAKPGNDDSKSAEKANLVKFTPNSSLKVLAPVGDPKDNNYNAETGLFGLDNKVSSTTYYIKGFAAAGRVKQVKNRIISVFVGTAGSLFDADSTLDLTFDDSLPLYVTSSQYADNYALKTASGFKTYDSASSKDKAAKFEKADDVFFMMSYDGDTTFQFSIDMLSNN